MNLERAEELLSDLSTETFKNNELIESIEKKIEQLGNKPYRDVKEHILSLQEKIETLHDTNQNIENGTIASCETAINILTPIVNSEPEVSDCLVNLSVGIRNGASQDISIAYDITLRKDFNLNLTNDSIENILSHVGLNGNDINDYETASSIVRMVLLRVGGKYFLPI